jgi:hypothetical protein
VAKSIIRLATPPWVRKLPEDEERNRHDFEALNPGKELQRDRMNGHFGQSENEDQHSEAEGDRDRHPGQHERYQQDEDEPRARAGRDLHVTELCCQAQSYEHNGQSDEDEGGKAGSFKRGRSAWFRLYGGGGNGHHRLLARR